VNLSSSYAGMAQPQQPSVHPNVVLPPAPQPEHLGRMVDVYA
jgi:hypothetical protein